DGGIVGQAAVDFIQQFRVDFALVGISGIDEDGSLLDFDYQEVRVSQAIIDNARQVFLAADSSKFGRNAVVRLGPISLVNRVISDSPPPAAIARL
ncbi:DeoR family transcriptional regulator, partial [Pseudomonas aeruginosa]